MVEQNVQGVSNGPQHPGDPSSTTPAPTSAAISPNAPFLMNNKYSIFMNFLAKLLGYSQVD